MFYSNLQNPEFCLIQVSDVEDTDHNSNAATQMQLSGRQFTTKMGIMFTQMLKAPIVPKINHSNATNFRTTSLFTM